MGEEKGRYFNWQITFGNILTILVFVVGGIAGYARLEEQVSNMARDLEEHKVNQQIEMKELVRRDVQETRNSFIDQQLKNITEKLDKILTEIRMR